MAKSERRRQRRVKRDGQAVYYAGESMDMKLPSVSIELSAGGMRIKAPTQPIVGSEIGVQFEMGDGEACIAATGEVVWTRLAPDARGTYEIGIKFPYLGKDTERRLQDYVARGKKE